MNTGFLKPWFHQEEYVKGILGKKVLVLGASAYCSDIKCPYYNDCAINQNTSAHDADCKERHGHAISESPSFDFSEDSEVTSFKRFFELMNQFISEKESKHEYSLESRMAYTNFVQHMIGGRYITLPSDCREEYLEAFEKTLKDLTPDVVIIWGCVVSVPIKNKKTSKGNDKFENTLKDDHYLFQWKNYYGEGKDVTFLNFYHPSSPAFYKEKEWDYMWDYLEKVFVKPT